MTDTTSPVPENDPIEQLLGRLKPGGPPVDFEAIDRLIAGVLDDDSEKQVRVLITTWATWHEAYQETRLDVDEAALDGLADSSVKQKEKTVRNTLLTLGTIAAIVTAAILLSGPPEPELESLSADLSYAQHLGVTPSDLIVVRDGTAEIESRDFEISFKPNRSGFFSLFRFVDGQWEAFPKTGQARESVTSESPFVYGPLAPPVGSATLVAVYSPVDLTEKTEQALQSKKPDEIRTVLSSLLDPDTVPWIQFLLLQVHTPPVE